uniref:NIF system FeS cluster assembly NifU N-terminal domain-containing protein n=1 Tax=Glycine max TaxID=3847 RepID=I1MTG8_SOYBN
MLRVGAKRVLETTLFGVRVPARLYHERVVDHYDNPRNVGSFDKNDPSVGTGLVGAPACGDVMKLQIKVDDKTGKIVDARFKTFGCGSAIASSSVATEWVKGRQMEEVLTIKNTMLAEDAIKAAVKDYEAKRAKATASGEAATEEKPATA